MFRVPVAILLATLLATPVAAQSSTSQSRLENSKRRISARTSTIRSNTNRSRSRSLRVASAQTDRASERRTRQAPAAELNGGPRPDIRASTPSVTSFPSSYAKGTVVIDTSRRRLLYVLSATKAYIYPISVGRAGFQWTGTHRITAKRDWPDWHPPAEMRERDPRLPVKMTGGLNNPLGAKALYLGSTLYRIHGTNNTSSIGRAASSGCFRMSNAHVSHLAGITRVGTRVVVVNALPARLAKSFSGRSNRAGADNGSRTEGTRQARVSSASRRASDMAWRRAILGTN